MNNSNIFNHFQTHDPIIAKLLPLVDLDGWPNDIPPEEYFSRLCRTIVGQQLSVKAASTIYNRFLELFPDQVVTPQLIIDIKDQSLRQVGMSWAKIKYVKDLADKTLNNQLPFIQFPLMNDQQIIDHLVSVKGIGLWTAEMFLMFTMGRADLFSKGDLDLKNAIIKLYGVKTKEYDREIDRIVTAWSPYKTYACLALWHSLDNTPKNSDSN